MWRYKAKEEVSFVTFNYDTMIEEAMSQVLDMSFKGINTYISHPKNRLFKLHGSTNWGQILDVDRPHDYNPQRIIRDAGVLKLTNEYIVVEGGGMLVEHNRLVQPAIRPSHRYQRQIHLSDRTYTKV